MPRLRIALLLAVGLGLAACATGPEYPLYTARAVAGEFGYFEEQLSDSRYRVSYQAPIETTYVYDDLAREREAERLLSVAYELALRRAAELALANGYPAFAVRQRENDVHVDLQRRYSDPFVGPYSFYPPFSLRRQYLFHPWYGYPGYSRPVAYLGAEVTLETELRRSPGGEDVFDARQLLDRLRAKDPGQA